MAAMNIILNGRFEVLKKLGEPSQPELFKVQDLNDVKK